MPSLRASKVGSSFSYFNNYQKTVSLISIYDRTAELRYHRIFIELKACPIVLYQMIVRNNSGQSAAILSNLLSEEIGGISIIFLRSFDPHGHKVERGEPPFSFSVVPRQIDRPPRMLGGTTLRGDKESAALKNECDPRAMRKSVAGSCEPLAK